jgi:hypothetical protein
MIRSRALEDKLRRQRADAKTLDNLFRRRIETGANGPKGDHAMNLAEDHSGIDPQAGADHEAVMRHVVEGTPVGPDLARRVRERAERITEEVYREHGELDPETINGLFRDDDEP